jgi:hypothetical protein
MAMVDLSPFGFPNMNEQMWLKQLDERRYEVSCIPFRVYGLALGDHVELEEGQFISQVVQGSGRRVLRVFFTDPRPSVTGDDLRQDLVRAVELAGLLSEWSGDRHVAIDMPSSSDMRGVYASVTREIEAGSAVWEWADSEPFQFNRSV